MKRTRVRHTDKELVAAVRKLYLKYKGCQHKRITAEIKASGWPTFSQSVLGTNRAHGRRIPGWIERFGWRKELERRAKKIDAARARRVNTFEKWLKTASPGMTWTAWHHRFICEHLRRVTEGECRRLMIFVPPRHGKSELVTVRYAAWRMLREPGQRVIIGCYSQKLANRFSRKVMRMYEARGEISRRKHAAEEWETAVGGSVKAVGVGAGITGFGGDLIIIDDPVKSRAVANSRTFRDKTWDWYKDDIHTRLEPGGAVILIQTRWHDDDLAGRLLKDMENGGEQWDVVRLPALAERGADLSVPPAVAGGLTSAFDSPGILTQAQIQPAATAAGTDELARSEGEALWPERYDRDELLATKTRLGPWSFAALYQQRPVPEGGRLFKAEWFANIVNKRPEGLIWHRGYDLAVSLKDSADYTASFRVAEDARTGMIYIADGFRARLEYPEQRRFVIERMEAEPDTRHGIELALHGKALVQDLLLDRRTRGRALRGVKVDGDKLLRAEAWAGYAEEGKIALVSGPWIHDFIDEACRFTGRGDAHDDQVDAVSLAIQMLRKRSAGHSF
ncbi:MAG: phage terminase large subunit [Pyrinomonadaceae bacterium]